jgi:hypothetical protein
MSLSLKLTKSKVPLVITSWILSVSILIPNIIAYAQNESSQTIQSGRITTDDGQVGQPEAETKDQGKQFQNIRCSNGSLVDRVSEFPSCDGCPSEPAGNDTLQCFPALQQNNDNNNTNVTNAGSINEVENSGDGQILTITTDKKSYGPREIVNITVKNSGTEALTFPNSILGLTIENAITHEKYPLFAAQVITTLDSGETKTLKWGQTDSFGKQVRTGDYTASVSSGGTKANTTFTVFSGDTQEI